MYQVLEQAMLLWEANPELINFCQIEGSLRSNNLRPTTTIGSSLVTKANYHASKETKPLIRAIKKHANEANRNVFLITIQNSSFVKRKT